MKQRHLIVRSRNISCKPLKEIVVSRPTILRLGSVTPTEEITKCKNPIEINSAESCKLSSNKLFMKARFKHAKVPTAEYLCCANFSSKVLNNLEKWGKIIIKHKHSSKGNGIYLIANDEEYLDWYRKYGHDSKSYIFERYYNYTREYRLHVTKEGCFYACRKMLKKDAEVRWHRHDSNSVWILEENPLFDKPSNWDKVVQDCIAALKSLGLDLAAFDIKIQSNKKENPKYIILESNSAPSLGEVAIKKYKELINRWTRN